eukprot:TRINITY_DN2004_c0_g3_i3.p1 TRINITY_DN2004_c0_g3~~TRINITY_DN2004_c0_g3_i3.p1  ORF type:complete len:227 (-),score=53.25 TRINITY_DN2004_c0_g3_i3:103-783(-)
MDNVVFLAGQPIIQCPNSEDWTPTSEFIYMFDDESQWKYRAWGALIRQASFMVGDNHQDLMDIAQRARQNAAILTTSLMGTGNIEWSDCQSYSRPNNVDAVRCTLTLPEELDVAALSLACSRPNCTLQIVSTDPVVVEYRPNYPDSFTSEPVGDSVDLADDALLTDGFSTQTFLADMTFTDSENSLLETAAQTSQQAGVGDATRYLSVQSFVSIEPIATPIAEEVF